MNLKRAGLGLVLAMFCFCMLASAEMPRQFYFEDYYATTNATIGLQLQLYDSITNGACLYEDSNTVEVVDGFYATLIGDNTVSGSLTNALAGGVIYVQVIINGAPLSPREPLIPVPYALNAAGVASNTITAAMIANGAITTNKLAGDVDARYVNVSGDAMGGDLDMDGGSLHNIAGIDWYGDGINVEGHSSFSSNIWADWNADMLDGSHASAFATTQQLAQKLSVTGGLANAIFIMTVNGGGGAEDHRAQLAVGGNGTIDLIGGEESVYDDNMHIRMRWDLGADEPAEPSIDLKPYSGAALRGLRESDRWWTDGRFSATNSGKTSEFFAVKSSRFVGDGSGLTDLPVTGLTTNEADARYVNVSEDTMTGDFTVMGEFSVWNGSPGSGPDVLVRRAAGEEDDAFRFYPDVEDDLPASIGPFTLWDSEGNIPLARINASVSSLLTNYLTATSALSTCVSKSGDTMTGNLDMAGNQITNFSQIVFRRNPSYIAQDTYFSNYYNVVFLKGAGLIVDGTVSGKGFDLGSHLTLKCLQYSGNIYQTNYVAKFETTTNVMNEIRVTGHLNMQGSAISNAVFVGDGSGLTDLPVTGLTTNEADARYINTSSDTMTGPLVVSASTDQTNLTVAGWAKIDYIPPQGGISMGIYTNR